MPTYDYRCNACEHEFELVQSMRAPVKRKCPACGKLKLERLIGTGAGFIIKGASPAQPGESSAQSDTSSETKGEDTSKDTVQAKDSPKSAETTTGDKPSSEKAEKKVSGSTSTPTHQAREGRGVGNLVDAARRRSREETGTSSRKKGSGTSRKTAKRPPKKG